VQAEERLKAIAAEDLAPWCKLGNVVFRASEVADGGGELQVTAHVRSDEVAHALERLRGERGFRGDDARFTWGGRSRFVRVASMTTTTTTARSKTFVLRLEPVMYFSLYWARESGTRRDGQAHTASASDGISQ
jgi:hypothetical protein